MRILVIGASGYIGGRLVPVLASLGHEMVLMSRDARPLAGRYPEARVVAADLLEPSSLGPAELRVGDALDFWRVEAVERPTLLRLRAEMRVPGRAWLQYEVTETARGSRLEQTAFFEPKGLPGLAYWYVLYPIHGFIFRGMVRRLARRALGARPGSDGFSSRSPDA